MNNHEHFPAPSDALDSAIEEYSATASTASPKAEELAGPASDLVAPEAQTTPRYDVMLSLVTKYHANQYRNREDIPYTEHLVGVASILQSAFAATGECQDDILLQDMHCAALGHDLLEDTAVTKEEILAASSPRALSMIEDLSNPDDDAHTDAYMEQLSQAPEESRLIKYCDLVENTTSVSYVLHEVGLEWAHNFYLPILTRSTATLAVTDFAKHQQTAKLLRDELATATNLLHAKIKLLEGDNRA